jgi:hypothetical protein
MAISLHGRQRQKFRADLLAHRESFSLTDADYAGRILKVSLNTLKKCLETGSAGSLSLKRQTFLRIFGHAGLDPHAYGLAVALPSRASPFGGYDKRDYAFLCGRYFLYRRSFLTARNINRMVLEIAPSQTKECLSFREIQYYVSDSGVRDEQHYAGDVYIDSNRSMLGFPASHEGQTRLMLVGMPQRVEGKDKLKMRGALLTYGVPRGFWQPAMSCVFIEGPQESRQANPRELSTTLYPDSDQFVRIATELSHAEEHATIQTPLMWRGGGTPSAPQETAMRQVSGG